MRSSPEFIEPLSRASMWDPDRKPCGREACLEACQLLVRWVGHVGRYLSHYLNCGCRSFIVTAAGFWRVLGCSGQMLRRRLHRVCTLLCSGRGQRGPEEEPLHVQGYLWICVTKSDVNFQHRDRGAGTNVDYCKCGEASSGAL